MGPRPSGGRHTCVCPHDPCRNASRGLPSASAEGCPEGDAESSPAAKDVEKLQGEWKVTHLLYNGKDMTEKFGLSFFFKGESATLEGDNAVLKEYPKLKFKLIPRRRRRSRTSPSSAAYTWRRSKESTSLKGDELQICLKVFAPRIALPITSPRRIPTTAPQAQAAEVGETCVSRFRWSMVGGMVALRPGSDAEPAPGSRR